MQWPRVYKNRPSGIYMSSSRSSKVLCYESTLCSVCTGRHMGILVTRKPSHTIILPAWHGGNRYSTLEHAASRAKHHGGHISPIRLRRKHCCYFSRKGKDGAHLLHSSSGIYRLSVFHINELHSEFGSDLSQPAQSGKQASNSAWQLWRWWMRTWWGKRAQTLPNCDSAEGDCVW